MKKLVIKLYYFIIFPIFSGYKGRSELVMYNSMKPNMFDIKFWALCDGVSSYMSKYTLYCGKNDRNAFQEEHDLGHRVVHDLTRDLL